MRPEESGEKSRDRPPEAEAVRMYDGAATPFQRMLRSGALRPIRQAVLDMVYNSLNPLQLGREIHRETAALLRLAERTGVQFT